MNYNHPFTAQARIYFTVTPILAGVRGRVVEVPVEANVPLKEGDVLFSVDRRPFEYAVEQKQAMLAEAQQNVQQLKASLDQATAETQRVDAQVKLAQENYDRQSKLFEERVVSKATLDTFARNIETATQSLNASRAAEERARLAYSSEIGGVNTSVAQLQADLSDAEFDLEQTVVRAPTTGFVTQVALRPGMYVVPAPLRPVMVFVNRGEGEHKLIGAFQQNSLQRVQAGDDAEIAFAAVPGRVFKGKVVQLLDTIPAGQLQATGVLQDINLQADPGRALAEIQVEDDISKYQIPLGATAQIALLTEHWHHVALLRRILLRMRSWENYVFLEGH
jgi:multidrug resistance efflux pump